MSDGPVGGGPVDDGPVDDDKLYMDRYKLDTVLGRGGTCTVFRAWDTRLQRYVAIKRLEQPLVEDPHARARFNREGRAIARLSHPHLVTLIDRGSTEGEEYLVFEYVEGRSLKEVLRESGPIEPKDACRIAGQIAEGLAQAHVVGIVHRDVKSQNILLDAEGRAKLTDFGIATGADLTQLTRAGAIIGSGRYMSPEQVQSRPVDARSDIYSLGIVMYEMLAGKPPFDGQTLAEIGRQHVREKPHSLLVVRPETPPGLARVVMRCLEKLPENRFQSMEELLGALVGLDLYSLERTSGGLVESLKRVGLGRADGAETGEWTPHPDAVRHPPERTRRPSGRRSAPSGVPLRRAKTGPGRRRAALLATLLVGAAVVAGLTWLIAGGAVQAPDVVGLTLDEAKDAAGDAGLDITVREEQVPVLEDRTTVVGQEPEPGVAVEGGELTVQITRPADAVAIADLDDLDPEGDQQERPEQLGNLQDDDPESAWTSEGYSTPSFGDTGKTGIGVAFRLTEPARIMRVRSEATGWEGALQVPAAEGGWEPVADLEGEQEQTITLDEPLQEGRLWITSLPQAAGEDGFHRMAINEVNFYN